MQLFWAIVGGLAFTILLVLSVHTLARANHAADQQEHLQQAEHARYIQLCEDRGGVPIVRYRRLTSCVFPPRLK